MIFLLETFLCLFFVIPAVLVCLYHLFLAGIGLFLSKKPRFQETQTVHFAILIPAHDEHGVIEQTLQSCLQLDYPKDLLDIYVIADNCSDDTAEIARSFGVNCFERQSETEKGKGYALAWAFPKILAESKCDAVLVLDADCIIDSHALKSFDYRITQSPSKETCFQLNYVVGNPDTSPLSYLLATANYLENDSFYAPMSALGLPVLLRGTGMVIPRSVLERNPWNAFSIVEDTEYTLQLIKRGINVQFVQETKILSEFPSEQKTLTAQRSRWIGGNLGFCVAEGFRFIGSGLVTLSVKKINTGWTLLLLSRPLILFHLLLTTVLALVWTLLMQNTECMLNSPCLFSSVIACWIGYFIYFVLGVWGLGFTQKRFFHLVRIPFSLLGYLSMSVGSILSKKPQQWTKTPRSGMET